MINSASAQEAEFVDDGPLILEPIVQGISETDYAYVYELNHKSYVSLPQMASYVGFKYERKDSFIKISWGIFPKQVDINLLTNEVTVNGQTEKYDSNDIRYIEDTIFASLGFYKRFLGIDAEIGYLEMNLKIEGQQEFPTITKKKLATRRKQDVYQFQRDSFKDYDFDDRLIGEPVLDISLGKGYTHRKGGYTENNDSYSLNLAAIAGGLDVNAYVYGDSFNNRDPRVRLRGSREFLDEPPNKLNLKKLNVGDISGIGNSYFTDAGSGRGAAVSSFKNLVMSADKTIDITGPIQDGWQVELYWNEQLLGYRQGGINGEYRFENLPVSYGLNTFKLVFYGPYGETRTEYKRYYSGTSPVKKGEVGYNIAAYQPDRYIIEDNEPPTYEKKTSKAVLDMTGYYGLTDNATFMAGYTQTPDYKREETQNFGMTGLQYAVDGVSLQYNLEQNLDTSDIGHHVEAQGDVYIGTLYAGIDQFNGIHSPISARGNDYMEDQYETRLSGMLPYNLPYYLSWSRGTYEYSKQDFDDISGRISKQLGGGINLTLENNYYHASNGGSEYDDLRLGAYKWWNAFSLEAWINHEIIPESKFKEFKLRGDWRTGRRTYLSAEYTHNLIEDMDYLSVSAGKVFDFGGLTLSLQTDRDLNLSTWLTYNISLAKVPSENRIIATGNSRFGETGSVEVNLRDEYDEPLEGVGLNANGLEKEVYTDSKGRAILMDLQTYEKTILKVDEETFPDVSLYPESNERKIVLRPGTIRTVNIPFVHKGAVEGQLKTKGMLMFGYLITAYNDKNEEVLSTFADTEGAFILDGLPYGTYKLVVSKDSVPLAEMSNVVVNDISIYIDGEIELKDMPKQAIIQEIEEQVKEQEQPVSAPLETSKKVNQHYGEKKYIITPKQYVGVKEQDEDKGFEEQMSKMASDLTDILEQTNVQSKEEQ